MKNMIALQEYSFEDPISLVRFSEDSKKILALNKSKNRLWAKAVYDPGFQAEIEDLELKIVNAVWVPDSYQILTFSDWGIKATIYNLIEEKQMILKSPKSHDKAFAFSNNKKFLAIAEKRNAKDYIGIYYCQNWQLMNYFEVNTIDLSDLKWSHNDSFLALWDSGYYFKWQVYLPTKQLIFEHEDPKLLGIKEFRLSEKEDYIAVITFDDTVVIYNAISWIKVIEFDPNTAEYNENTRYYREEADPDAHNVKLMDKQQPKIFERVDKIKPKQVNLEKTMGKRCYLDWSKYSEYLAFKLSSYPNSVFVLEMCSLSVHTLITTKTLVKDLNFKGNLLHFSWGGPNFGIWEESNVGVANPFFGSKMFKCSKLEWSKDAKQMVLRSKNEICLYYPNESLANQLNPRRPGIQARTNFSLKQSTIASAQIITENQKYNFERRSQIQPQDGEYDLQNQHSYGMSKSRLEHSPGYQINIDESFRSKKPFDPTTSRDDYPAHEISYLNDQSIIHQNHNQMLDDSLREENDGMSPRNQLPQPLMKHNINTDDLLEEYDNNQKLSGHKIASIESDLMLNYSKESSSRFNKFGTIEGNHHSQAFNHETFGGDTHPDVDSLQQHHPRTNFNPNYN